MTAQEKMAEIKKNVGSVKDPEIIFAMNQLYRELEKEIVKLRLKEDLSDQFKLIWGDSISDNGGDNKIKKGWETWTRRYNYENSIEIGLSIKPEDNRYCVNFPLSLFEVIE